MSGVINSGPAGIAGPRVRKRLLPRLQADCFSGIFLGQREKIENGVYVPAERDLQVALETFFNLGDAHYRDSKWFNPQYHGSRLQRLMAFGTGYLGALPATSPFGRQSTFFPWCYGYKDFKPNAFDAVGPYRVLRPPGRTAIQGDAGYTLPAIAGAGRTSSQIALFWQPGIVDESALTSARDTIFPGLQVLLSTKDLGPMKTSAGDINYVYFQQQTNGATVKSGLYGTFPAQPGGTLAVAAYRNEPPIDSLSDARAWTLAEETSALAQVAGRLCVPGASATAGDANFSTACSAEQ